MHCAQVFWLVIFTATTDNDDKDDKASTTSSTDVNVKPEFISSRSSFFLFLYFLDYWCHEFFFYRVQQFTCNLGLNFSLSCISK
jgi:hypothetical protein